MTHIYFGTCLFSGHSDLLVSCRGPASLTWLLCLNSHRRQEQVDHPVLTFLLNISVVNTFVKFELGVCRTYPSVLFFSFVLIINHEHSGKTIAKVNITSVSNILQCPIQKPGANICGMSGPVVFNIFFSYWCSLEKMM